MVNCPHIPGTLAYWSSWCMLSACVNCNVFQSRYGLLIHGLRGRQSWPAWLMVNEMKLLRGFPFIDGHGTIHGLDQGHTFLCLRINIQHYQTNPSLPKLLPNRIEWIFSRSFVILKLRDCWEASCSMDCLVFLGNSYICYINRFEALILSGRELSHVGGGPLTCQNPLESSSILDYALAISLGIALKSADC